MLACISRSYRVLPLVLAVCVGIAAGVGGYTFRYAEGLSYFKTDPKACVNCHMIGGKGSPVGPALDGIAKTKDEAYLIESLAEPNAKLAENYTATPVSPMPPIFAPLSMMRTCTRAMREGGRIGYRMLSPMTVGRPWATAIAAWCSMIAGEAPPTTIEAQSSTAALKGSTEDEQFFDDHRKAA